MPEGNQDQGVRLVGVDPGYAALGLSVARLTAAGLIFERVTVLRTKASARKRRVRRADDLGERIGTIAAALHALLVEVRPVAVCCESSALPFGRVRGSVVSALGRVRGVLDGLCHVERVPILEDSAQALKVATAGKANASKAEVQAALEAAYPELRAMWPQQRGLQEHAADSCASIVACHNDGVVLASLRAREAA